MVCKRSTNPLPLLKYLKDWWSCFRNMLTVVNTKQMEPASWHATAVYETDPLHCHADTGKQWLPSWRAEFCRPHSWVPKSSFLTDTPMFLLSLLTYYRDATVAMCMQSQLTFGAVSGNSSNISSIALLSRPWHLLGQEIIALHFIACGHVLTCAIPFIRSQRILLGLCKFH